MPNLSATLDLLRSPLELPCGTLLKNRLVKPAMSDSLGDGRGDPTPAQMRLYERWAEGGVGLSIIGEVQIDPRYPEKPGNLVLSPDSDRHALQSLTRRAGIEGARIWAQLGHAGALAHPPISAPKGPSALKVGDFECAGMTIDEIRELPEQFANAAMLAKTTGFSGVQIHAAHGFLLSQFLSPLFNRRTDTYGGSIEARCRILREVTTRVREVVGPAFPIGIKINATDQLEGGLTRDEAIEVVRLLDATSLDLIEISGGTYFPGARAASDAASSGPYFLEFSRRARRVTDKLIVTTGGFKIRRQVVDALTDKSTDGVGLARAMVLNPQLARTWLAEQGGDPVFPRFAASPPGGITAWYTMRLTALGEDRESTFRLELPAALQAYEARDAERCETWRARFAR